jgi:hypothetical protein
MGHSLAGDGPSKIEASLKRDGSARVSAGREPSKIEDSLKRDGSAIFSSDALSIPPPQTVRKPIFYRYSKPFLHKKCHIYFLKKIYLTLTTE